MLDFERDIMKMTGQIGRDFPQEGSLRQQREYLEERRAMGAAPEETKRCTKCGRTLSRDHFFSNKSRKDGLGVHCRECATKGIRASLQKRAILKAQAKSRAAATSPAEASKEPSAAPSAKQAPEPLPAPSDERTPEERYADAMGMFSDLALASELRARGYDVTARKTIITEL